VKMLFAAVHESAVGILRHHNALRIDVRFRANRTLSRHRRMTGFDPQETFALHTNLVRIASSLRADMIFGKDRSYSCTSKFYSRPFRL
jgi:hypothetical protein